MMYQKGTRAVKPIVFHSGIMQMYLDGDSFRVSFKWVVIISTKQETAHTQSAKVSTCYTLWHFGDWSLITGKGGLQNGRGCK